MFVTRHSHIVDVVLADKLWALYELAYHGMSEATVSREVLFRSEFDAALADSTNRVWVLWDDSAPIGMGLVATDIGNTRYLSRAYFEAHYPDHVRRNAVHYVMWLVMHPAHAARGAIVKLCKEGMALEAEEGALFVFDTPEVNQPTDRGGLAELTWRISRLVGAKGPLHQIGTNRYYAIDFAEAETADDSDEIAARAFLDQSRSQR